MSRAHLNTDFHLQVTVHFMREINKGKSCIVIKKHFQ